MNVDTLTPLGTEFFLPKSIYITIHYTMLREEIYVNTANEFGVSVGVATIMGYKQLKDSVREIEPKTYKKMSSELSVNKLITDCIDDGLYQHLQRELFRIRSKGKKISELTIYKQAIKNIRNGNSTTITKPSKILTNR